MKSHTLHIGSPGIAPSAFGTSFGDSGTNSGHFGTNLRTFGTNSAQLGTNLPLLGTNSHLVPYVVVSADDSCRFKSPGRAPGDPSPRDPRVPLPAALRARLADPHVTAQRLHVNQTACQMTLDHAPDSTTRCVTTDSVRLWGRMGMAVSACHTPVFTRIITHVRKRFRSCCVTWRTMRKRGLRNA